MRYLLCLLLAGGALAFSSCKNTWSQEDKDNYRHTCMESLGVPDDDTGKARAYCDCMLQKITEKYPNVNDMLEHMEDVINDPDLQACKKELQ
jgi:hypothetical protein